MFASGSIVVSWHGWEKVMLYMEIQTTMEPIHPDRVDYVDVTFNLHAIPVKVCTDVVYFIKWLRIMANKKLDMEYSLQYCCYGIENENFSPRVQK